MKTTRRLIYLAGIYQCWVPTTYLLKSIYNQTTEETPLKQRLNSRYGGQGQWALVTGASEGIGKAYAVDLAKSGYNVTLVSRSQEKLEKAEAELKQVNPQISTRVVPFDCTKAAPGEYAQLFQAEQPTSVVISNAGVMHNSMFLDTEPALLEAMIKTNVHPQLYLTKYALRHFEETHQDFRFKKALVYISSCIALFDMTGTATYGGTKTSNRVFNDLMIQQAWCSNFFKTLLDFQRVHPAATTSALNNFSTGPEYVMPDEISYGSLCDLGDIPATCGAIKHGLQATLLFPFLNWPPFSKKIGDEYQRKVRARRNK